MADRRSLPPHEDELSLALLRSADRDEPSHAAYAKVATTLGVGAAVGLGASLPAPAALASAGLSVSSLARWSGSLFGKLVLAGVSGALLVAGAWTLLTRHRAANDGAGRVAVLSAPHATTLPAPANPAIAGNTTPPSVVAVSAAQSAAPVDAVAVTPSTAVSSSNVVPSNAPPSNVAPGNREVIANSATAAKSALTQLGARPPGEHVARASSLPEQVLSLDRARVALNSGDPSGALLEIAHYRSAWPKGVFLTEASVLEIEALAKRGNIVLAGMRAQAFVAAHPDSPQVERLRALIPSDAR